MNFLIFLALIVSVVVAISFLRQQSQKQEAGFNQVSGLLSALRKEVAELRAGMPRGVPTPQAEATERPAPDVVPDAVPTSPPRDVSGHEPEIVTPWVVEEPAESVLSGPVAPTRGSQSSTPPISYRPVIVPVEATPSTPGPASAAVCSRSSRGYPAALKSRPAKHCKQSGTGSSSAKSTYRKAYRWNTPWPVNGCCGWGF